MSSITFGILTISDTCSEHKRDDISGSILKNLITNQELEIRKLFKGQIQCSDIIPDNECIIIETLIRWSDKIRVNVILTTGGTGFSSRDVTPEATKKVVTKEVPGITYAMLSESLKITPMAILSRSFCGIRNQTLIINFPGSPKAVKECFSAIVGIIPHAVDIILDIKKNVTMTHSIQKDKYHSYLHKKSKVSLNLDNIAGRHRESPYPLITIEESHKILKDSIDKEIPLVKVNIWESFGRVLAKTVYSSYNIPPFRASLKDGYAVIDRDGKGIRKVLCGLEAGDEPGCVKILSGTCVRINTGAAVPDEATAVVQVEDTKLIETEINGKEEKKIEILIEPKLGLNIRSIGSDIKKNSAVLKAGTKIGAVEIGILATCGCTQILVTPIPKIGILSTGNELQDIGEILKPGHIYDSNKITLIMMLKENGFDAIDIGIVPDKETLMIDAIENALQDMDIIITTGSVSMGDRDILKPILKEIFKATIHFGRVNLKPGKPTTYATCEYQGKKKYFLCLPGNPASAIVTMNLFVFPLLNYLTRNNEKPVIVKVMLTSTYMLDSVPEFARVILKWSDDNVYPKAYTTGSQISSKLLSCKNANALLMLPEKTTIQKELHSGTLVNAMLLKFNQYDD